MRQFTIFILLSIIAFSCASTRKDDSKVNMDDYPCFYNDRVENEERRIYKYIMSYSLTDTLLKEKGEVVLNPNHPINVVPFERDTSTLYTCMTKIEYPDLWKEMQHQGSCYYGIKIDENGIIQTIESLKTISANDLILPQIERHLLHLKFVEEKYFGRNFLFLVKLRIY